MSNAVIISNHNNALENAVLSVNGIKPATNTAERTTLVKNGTGQVALIGGYTGTEDAIVDIVIDGDGVVTPQVSAVTKFGVGNGELSGVSADVGATAETLTITLKSKGKDTRKARVAIFNVVIEALVAPGNGITITVDESGLIYTPTTYSLLDAIQSGVSEFTGPQWDFGAYPLDADGYLNENTARLAFQGFPEIHYQHKTFINGEWVYTLTPATLRTISAGTLISAVTGDRTITVSDGITDEVYSGIITPYDFLNQLSTSVLVTVVGVVGDDRSPGGQNGREFNVKTNSYYLPITAEGSAFATTLDNVAVNPNGPTQTFEAECIDNSSPGYEQWGVIGSVDGEQSDATTGVAYSSASANVNFTIPLKLPETKGTTSGVIEFAARDEGESKPDAKVDPVIALEKATAKSVTYIYTKRPVDTGCVPAADLLRSRPSKQCGGNFELPDDEGGTNVAAVSDAHQAILEDVSKFESNLVSGNRQITGYGELRTAIYDVALAQRCRSILDELANDVHVFGTLDFDARVDSTPYDEYKRLEPVPSNGYVYRVIDPGTTAASQPSYSTTIDDTFTDGTAIIKCIAEKPVEAIETLLLDISTDLNILALMSLKYGSYDLNVIPTLTAGGTYALGQLVKYGQTVQVTQSYIWVGACVQAGTAGTDPDFIGAEIGDVTNGGADDSTAVFLIVGFIPSDGEAEFIGQEDINYTTATKNGYSNSIDDYVSYYVSRANDIRRVAGLDPKTDASTTGGGCWQDIGTEYWWVPEGTDYLPAFTNTPYHSVVYDENQNIVPTYEFFFEILVHEPCEGLFKEGDRAIVTIGDINTTYKIGDKFTIPIIHAEPLQLTGGQIGDNTYVFGVNGSVTGSLPDYSVIHGAEADYNQNNLHWIYTRGTIEAEIGDGFRVTVEEGSFKWQIDGGGYFTGIPITDTPIALALGLSVQFTRGVGTSFVVDDAWQFKVHQPFALSNLLNPGALYFHSGANAPQITADLGGLTTISAVAIPRHQIPNSVTQILIEGSDDGGATWPYSQLITWQSGAIAALIDPAWLVDYARLTIVGATQIPISWLWFGNPSYTEHCPRTKLNIVYDMESGAISDQNIGYGWGGEINYEWLSQSELDDLIDVINYSKINGNYGIVVIPQSDNTDEAMFTKIDTNNIEITDFREFGLADKTDRVMSAVLPLVPVTR